jgi:DNA-binding response OmpR family regulator
MAKKRILVIDDMPNIVTMVKARLEASGYEVTVVSSIKEGSEEAKKEEPDVILLDGVLVKANHYDGFYQLKLEFALTKIPMIISVGKEELEEFKKKVGDFSSYCLKPLNTIDLLGHVRVALQRK